MTRYSERRRVLLTFLILGSILIIILAGGGLWYTSKPAFCRTCHEMATFYMSWSYSTHGRVAECLDCHAEPGVIGKIKADLNGIRYLWSKLTGRSQRGIFKAVIANISCLQCHQQTKLENIKNAKLVAHKIHLERNIKCTKCHKDIVHGTLRAIEIKPPIEVCINCHRQEATLVDEKALISVTQPNLRSY